MIAFNIINNFYSHPEKNDLEGNLQNVKNTSLKLDESRALCNLILKYKPTATLEIGLALGGSAVAIIGAKMESGIDKKHIALEPFQKSLTKSAGIIELERLGLENSIEVKEEYSEIFLTKAF